MKSIVRGGGLMAGAALMLSGCGSLGGARDSGPTTKPVPATAETGVVDVPVTIGDPYKIADATYTPTDVADIARRAERVPAAVTTMLKEWGVDV